MIPSPHRHVRRPRASRPHGFTLVESVVGLAIFAVLTLVVGRLGFENSRSQLYLETQLDAQNEARFALTRMTQELRGAATSDVGGHPIEYADPLAISFFTNVDLDEEKERIRYFVEGTTLKRAVLEPSEVTEKITDLARSVVNGGEGGSIFTYYGAEYDAFTKKDPLSPPVTPQAIRIVEVALVIDADPETLPAGVTISSQIAIRSLIDQPFIPALVGEFKPNITALTVTDDRTEAKPGEVLTNTIRVVNDGNASAVNLKVTGTLPSSFATLVPGSVSGGGTVSGGAITWTGRVIPPKSSRSFTWKHAVSNDTPDGTELKTAAQLEGPGVSRAATDTTTIRRPGPRFTTFQKSAWVANNTVYPGQSWYYTISIRNTGELDATNVTVVDTLPQEVKFADYAILYDPALGKYVNGTYDAATHTVTWSGLTAPQSRYIWGYLRVTLPVEFEDTVKGGKTSVDITNNLALTYQGPSGPVTLNTSKTVTAVLGGKPKLSIYKTDYQTSVAPGRQFWYYIYATNTGTGSARDVRFEDPLPPAVAYENYSMAYCGGVATAAPAYDPATHTLTLTGATVPPNSSCWLYISVRAKPDTPSGTVATNTVTMTHNKTPYRATDTTIIEEPVARLTYSYKYAWSSANWRRIYYERQVQRGDRFTYYVIVYNTGLAPATGTRIVEKLPLYLTYVENSARFWWPQSSGTYNAATREVVWENVTIPARSYGYVSVDVVVQDDAPNGEKLTNVASAFHEQTVLVTNHTLTVIVPEGNINSVTKTDGRTTVLNGETLTYTIQVKNVGEGAARDVTVTDTLPRDVTFQSATDGGTYNADAHTVTWSGLTIQGRSTKTLRVTARVNDAAEAGTVLQNTVVTKDEKGRELSAIDTTTVVRPKANFTAFQKTDERDTAVINELLTYKISIKNAGDGAGTVNITDTLPAEVVFDSSPDGSYNEAAGTVTWEGLALDPGQTRSVTFKARVKASVADGTILTDTAKATAAETDLTATDTTKVIVPPPV